MEINGKAIGCGVVLIVLAGGAALFFPAYQRAKAIASLSSKRIDVSLRDEPALQKAAYVDKDVGCRIRLPASLPPPVKGVMAEGALGSFAAGRKGESFMFVKAVDRGAKDFESFVRANRLSLEKVEKQTFDDQGFSDINGYRTYVITGRGSFESMALRTRYYLIDGPLGKAYIIGVVTTEDRWPTMESAFDSSASTLEIGDFAPSAIAQRPAAPAPRPPSGATPPSPVPQAPSPVTQTPAPAPKPVPVPLKAGPPKIVEIELDGKWTPGVVLAESDTKYRVRLFKPQLHYAVFDKSRFRPSDAKMPPGFLDKEPPNPGDWETPLSRRFTTPGTPGAASINVDEAVRLLGSQFDRQNAADALAAMTPDKQHQAAVCKALLAVYNGQSSYFEKQSTAKALGVWADDATEKEFVKRLADETSFMDREPVFAMLTARKTPAAAEAIAGRLKVMRDMHAAENALRQMGPVAEAALCKLLTDTDRENPRLAARVLMEIGTKDSLPALKTASESSDPAVATTAKVAIQRIERRINRPSFPARPATP